MWYGTFPNYNSVIYSAASQADLEMLDLAQRQGHILHSCGIKLCLTH